MKFLNSDELFYRPHSAAWAQHDGVLHVLPEEHGEHDTNIDWNVLGSDFSMSQAASERAALQREVSVSVIVEERAHWIAVTSPFMGRTEHPVAPLAWQALAFYLASAAIWFARRGRNLLDEDFSLYSSTDPVFGRPGVVMPVGDLISRYAPRGLEDQMYEALNVMTTPRLRARPETAEERRKRTGSRR